VTGAGGQVGSALCRLGQQVAFEMVGLGSGELDIGDEQAIRSAVASIQPDVIINAAAYTAVDKAEQEHEKAYRINSDGPRYLAREAAIADIPLLHFSTDYVFDGTKAGAYVETDPVAPLGVYGASKLAGELAIQRECSNFLIFRTSWVFGLEGQNFPKTMLRLASERPEIRVVADQWGCPTFADDIARAVFGVLEVYREAGSLPWGIYHYAGRSSCSWHEFAISILDMAYKMKVIASLPLLTGISTADYPTAAKRPANSRLDCSKFAGVFSGISLSDWVAGEKSLLEKA
jgi:dTDP-4-dehydrorhamnose reductase